MLMEKDLIVDDAKYSYVPAQDEKVMKYAYIELKG
jgi:hypothetical protein